MILEEKTYEKFGYYPSDLTRQSGKRILAACDDCGKVREMSKNQYRARCLSCAKKGKNHPQWKGGEVKRICKKCNSEFSVKPYRIKIGGGKFCSRKCNGEYNRRMVKMPKYHTKLELIFEEICKNNNLPFKYTGDGSFWIGKLNPDFIECNGKRVVVEIFGDYWHSPLLNRNMKKHGTLEYRKQYYKRHKWIAIFIWESDLKREDTEEFVLSQLKKDIK